MGDMDQRDAQVLLRTTQQHESRASHWPSHPLRAARKPRRRASSPLSRRRTYAWLSRRRAAFRRFTPTNDGSSRATSRLIFADSRVSASRRCEASCASGDVYARRPLVLASSSLMADDMHADAPMRCRRYDDFAA